MYGVILCLVLLLPVLPGCSGTTAPHTLQEMRGAFLLQGAYIVSSSTGASGEMYTYTADMPLKEATELFEDRIREMGIRKTGRSSGGGMWRFEGVYGDSALPGVFRLTVTEQPGAVEVSVKYGTDERENVLLQQIDNRAAEAAFIPEGSALVYINVGRIELESDLALEDLLDFYTAAVGQDLGIAYYSLDRLEGSSEGFVIRSTFRTGKEPDLSVSHLYQYDRLVVTVSERTEWREIVIRYPAVIGPDFGAPSLTQEELTGIFAPPGGSGGPWLLYFFREGYDADAMKDRYLGILAQGGFTVLDVRKTRDGFWLITGTYGLREYFFVSLDPPYVQLYFSMYA